MSNYPDGMDWGAYDDYQNPKLKCGHRADDYCGCFWNVVVGKITANVNKRKMMKMTKIYDDGSSYAWTPEMGKEGIVIRISKSTLTSPLWCAQQMWIEQNYPRKQELVKHLVVGDDVHNGLEMYYDNLEKSGDLDLLHKQAQKGIDISKTLMRHIPNEKDIVNNRRMKIKSFLSMKTTIISTWNG